MRRTILMVAAALLVCLAVTGCNGAASGGGGSPESLVGTTWALSGGAAMGIEMSLDDISAAMGELSFTFDDETNYTGTAAGTSQSGTYVRDGDKVVFDGGDAEATISGGEMTMEMAQDGITISLTFTLQQ